MNPFLFELQCIVDSRGSLSVFQPSKDFSFSIQRVFFLYGVPPLQSRAGHALKSCDQILIASSGSFTVTTENLVVKNEFLLDLPNQALFIPANTWREIRSFSPGAVCTVLATEVYNEKGYYRTKEEFLRAQKKRET